MVLLTITPLVLEGLKELKFEEGKEIQESMELTASGEPSLLDPQVGNPISHGQIIALSRDLKTKQLERYTLEDLLKGSKIYVPPPPHKPEPVRTFMT